MAVKKSKIRRNAKEKAEFLLYCLRPNQSVAHCCREYLIAESLYYRWLKSFVSGGTKALERKVGLQKTNAPRAISNHSTELLLPKSRFSEFLHQEANISGNYSVKEKMHIIKMCTESFVLTTQFLEYLGVPRSSFYNWIKCIRSYGKLLDQKKRNHM